ncbi:MAG TPA: hypothetical protein EYQ25_09675, partial [Planctomycetes bacterium]|nr:hypothetical protein [Planctomycetota bacterium]
MRSTPSGENSTKGHESVPTHQPKIPRYCAPLDVLLPLPCLDFLGSLTSTTPTTATGPATHSTSRGSPPDVRRGTEGLETHPRTAAGYEPNVVGPDPRDPSVPEPICKDQSPEAFSLQGNPVVSMERAKVPSHKDFPHVHSSSIKTTFWLPLESPRLLKGAALHCGRLVTESGTTGSTAQETQTTNFMAFDPTRVSFGDSIVSGHVQSAEAESVDHSASSRDGTDSVFYSDLDSSNEMRCENDHGWVKDLLMLLKKAEATCSQHGISLLMLFNETTDFSLFKRERELVRRLRELMAKAAAVGKVGSDVDAFFRSAGSDMTSSPIGSRMDEATFGAHQQGSTCSLLDETRHCDSTRLGPLGPQQGDQPRKDFRPTTVRRLIEDEAFVEINVMKTVDARKGQRRAKGRAAATQPNPAIVRPTSEISQLPDRVQGMIREVARLRLERTNLSRAKDLPSIEDGATDATPEIAALIDSGAQKMARQRLLGDKDVQIAKVKGVSGKSEDAGKIIHDGKAGELPEYLLGNQPIVSTSEVQRHAKRYALFLGNKGGLFHLDKAACEHLYREARKRSTPGKKPMLFAGSRPEISSTDYASLRAEMGMAEVAEETVRRHLIAYNDVLPYRDVLEVGGELSYRLRGEEHAWTPETVALLQHAVRAGDRGKYQAFSRRMNEQDVKLKNLRGLFEFKFADEPIPLDEVEGIAEIFKRFATGAMSFGSISWEAHTNLAIAMNRIGGLSNSGEGGEEAERYRPLKNGDSMRSGIKQVASGRFGVTAEYLVNASMLQIKMAQGAKPGEGGQL